jgi:hypothetical protein
MAMIGTVRLSARFRFRIAMGCLITVHDRHADIHQHRVKEAGIGILKQLQAGHAVIRSLHNHAELFQQRLGDLLIQRMVLAQQNMLSGQRLRLCLPDAGRSGRLFLRNGVRLFKCQHDADRRAFAEAALDFDGAAHGIHHLLGDGQSQTGAADAGIVVPVLLGERFKQRLLELFAHTGAVIDDLDAVLDPAVRLDLGNITVSDPAAFRRILDGIGQQIEHDAVYLQLVRQHNASFRHRDLRDQLLILLRADRPDHSVDVLFKLLCGIGFRTQFQISPLSALAISSTSLISPSRNLEESIDLIQTFLCLGIVSMFLRQIGHAYDAVERRAHIVAHA